MSIASARRVRVIVTADDFGLSPKVNEGILVAFHRGVVRNTALLVNFPDASASSELLRGADGLDVGIHLNLTAGRPISEPSAVSTLIRTDGTFFPLWTLLARVASRRIAWDEAYGEWNAQIQHGIRLGQTFSSISSHQHVHMLPPLMRIAAKLARAYAIPFVRLSHFTRERTFPYPPAKAHLLNPLSRMARRILTSERLGHNDSLLAIHRPAAPQAAATLCRTLRTVAPGLYEMVSHPGFTDPLLAERDDYLVDRLEEMKILTSTELIAAFRDGIELTTYRHLQAGAPHPAPALSPVV